MRRSRLVAKHNLEKNGTDLAQPVPGWTDVQWSELNQDARQQVKQKDNPPNYEEYTSIGGFGRAKRPPPPEFDGDDWHALSRAQRRTFRQTLPKHSRAEHENDIWDTITKVQHGTRKEEFEHGHGEVLDQYLEDLRKRLNDGHVNHKAATDTLLLPFLPRKDSGLPRQQIFEQLRERPLMVSNSALNQILNISESNDDDSRPDGGLCYIISWELKKNDLLNLMTNIENDLSTPFSCPQFESWKKQIKGVADETHVFIRYVGQTMNKTPLERYKSSTWPKSRLTTYEVFHKHLKRLPIWSYDRRIFSLRDTFVSRPSITETSKAMQASQAMQERTDLYECVMICLFGPTSLLNTQLGGRNLVYSLSKLDTTLFDRMCTSVAQRLVGSRTIEMKMGIDEGIFSSLSEKRIEWMRVSSGQDRASVEKNEKQIRTYFLEEVTHGLIEGQCLVGIVGDAPPKHAIKETTGFWDGSSQTARTVYRVLSILSSLESKSAAEFSKTFVKLVSFINCFPFPKEYTTTLDEKATKMLQSYFQIVQPILTITLGIRALSQCIGKKPEKIIPIVGRTYIQDVGAESCCTYTIVLPHMHPGFHARSDQSAAEKRLLVLCWFVTWMYIDTALSCLTTGESKKADRHTLCFTIVREAQEKLTKTGLGEALEQAREAYIQHQHIRKSFEVAK